jgi:dTDP-4-dehydrorhamnose 3,5-epimerase
MEPAFDTLAPGAVGQPQTHGTLRAQATPLDGVVVLAPRRFGDARGWFMESYNQQQFDAAVGGPVRFVQDNHSCSQRGVLRGLHYQAAPQAQGKLVRVTRGAAWDVAVDLRRGSPSLGRWFGLELSAANGLQLWIPEGFAHGFLALEDGTEFAYKTTAFYAPRAERTIAWNDPQLAVAWPLARLEGPPQVSDKDAAGGAFAQAELFD